MKVSKHLIRAPATNGQTDDVGVNTSTMEGHSTTSMETVGRNMQGIDAEGEKEGSGTVLDEHRTIFLALA